MQVEVTNLIFSYDKKHPVIKDLTFSIKQGEIAGLLGDSGSGKSTILRLISGLEKPNKGSIKVNNEVYVNKNTFIPAEKRKIGMVFQDYALFPHLTVEKNIAFGLGKMSKNDVKKRVIKMLELVGLTDKATKYPHELSGGEQQRIALARSIAPGPKLLLLDEPFSNLDASIKSRIRNELYQIIKKSNITAIFVTHDKEDAYAISDQIIDIKKSI
jgi:iron(III) transport system ATP-binding protein